MEENKDSATVRFMRAIFGEDISSTPPKPVTPEEVALRQQKCGELKKKLGDVLESLSERERKVLELRFGLTDGYARSLEEIGKQFKVTRERIRQIEAKGLRKMRHPTRTKHLQGFLEEESKD